jgi:hypothetical protein
LRMKLAAFDQEADSVVSAQFSAEGAHRTGPGRRVALLPRTGSAHTAVAGGRAGDRYHYRTVPAGSSELHFTSLQQSLLYLLAANGRGFCSVACRAGNRERSHCAQFNAGQPISESNSDKRRLNGPG